MMTVLEIASACVDALNHPERSRPDPPLITLVWTKGKNPFPRKGWPRPKHRLGENRRGEKVYLYDATNMLAALVANGLLKMDVKPKEGGNDVFSRGNH